MPIKKLPNKFSLWFLFIAMFVLTSCQLGLDGAEVNRTETSEQQVTLKVYFSGDKKSATDEVWSTIGDYVQSKGLNVKFNVQFIPVGDYRNKMLVMTASGDQWDMIFDADWLSYKQMAANGAYMSLNELLPRYAPHLYKKYQEQGTLSAATVNGSIVGLPWTMKMNQRFYAQWRSDMTKKAGINPLANSIQTIEDVDRFLHELKEAYPNAKLSRTIPMAIYQLRDEWADLGFHSMGFYLNDPEVRIQPIEQQPFFIEAAVMAKKWYTDGIINKDIMYDKEDGAALWRNGNMFFTVQSHEWVNANPGFADPSYEQESSLLYPDRQFANRSALANVIAINRHSEHPESVLRFLDMLETDRTLNDLVQYGIEGKTYIENGQTVRYPQGLNTTTSNYMEWGGQWAFWKPQFMRPNPTYEEDFWIKEAMFASEPNNINSPLDGLFISEDNIKRELEKRDRLIDEWSENIEFGTTRDPVQSVIEYIHLQKEAGLDIIVAEAQRQIDAYLANK
jgi:putative aldouronate transport system substrate-binding protein